MRLLAFFFLAFFATANLTAQVAQTVIVEHFTNTNCGICSNKNPAFFTNLEAHPDVLHIAYHPSSPYASCLFSQHNPDDNDARTYYYSIYGGTPRLVINGEVISASTNYGNSSLFTPYVDQTTVASINIQQQKDGDNIKALITITTEATHNFGELILSVPMAEKIVNYNAPNGENVHHNVFRAYGTATPIMPITLPATVGETVSLLVEVPANSEWIYDQMFTTAILQDPSTDNVVQAAAVSPDMNVMITTNVAEQNTLEGVSISPNPTENQLTIQLTDNAASTGTLYDLAGQLVWKVAFEGQTTINLNNSLSGVYVLKVENVNGVSVQKVLVK